MKQKRICLLILLPISWLIITIVKQNNEIAEFIFARSIYKWYARFLSSITGLLPFSLMELGIIITPILVFIFLAVFISSLIKDKEDRVRRIKNLIINILCIFSVVFFWITIVCSVNYYRYTFSEISELVVEDSSLELLEALSMDLVDRANDLREQIQMVDENGVMKSSFSSFKEMGEEALESFVHMNEEYEVFDYKVALPKPIFFSYLMSYTDLVGVYFPLTMETNINIDVADYSIPFTMNHELAHAYGFMREDEANFIAYLACMKSDNIDFRYSGTMLALIHAGNQLNRRNPEAYSRLWDRYSEGVVKDLRGNSAYWAKFADNKISEVSNAINDTYLKANNQQDGVQSYGRMVDLLLAEYKSIKEQN